MKLSVPIFKLMYHFSYKAGDRALRNAPPMESYRPLLDEPYGEDAQQVFDLYRAREEKRNRILLVDIHGGYYVRGRHRDNYVFALEFLEEGFDVCSVEYRLNGGGIETRDQLQDIGRFLRYLFSHREELNLTDIERFYITGDSAGGHLALYIAEALHAPEAGVDLTGVQLDGVLVNCPSYDYAAYRDMDYDTKAMKRWYLGPHYTEPGYLEAVSPRTYIRKLAIPVFVSTCRNDFLREGVLRLVSDLKQYQKPHVFVDISDEEKAVGHVHNVGNPKHPASVKVNRAMMEFMRNRTKWDEIS